MKNTDLKQVRPDHSVILDWIVPGASVLELGCGSGDLMTLLSERRNAIVKGIEIDEQAIFKCVSKGLSVSHEDIDDGLSEYADAAFDYVVLNRCLQEVRKPRVALSEAVRVGKNVIVGFANFASVSARLQLGIGGRAPVTSALPFQWYDTPNLHFLSIRDFILYCSGNRLVIERSAFLRGHRQVRVLPNLLAESCLFEIRAATSDVDVYST